MAEHEYEVIFHFSVELLLLRALECLRRTSEVCVERVLCCWQEMVDFTAEKVDS